MEPLAVAAYCSVSLIPVRREPSHRAEMTSQLLFGEHFSVLESGQGWLRIMSWHDGYEGWIEDACVYRSTPEDRIGPVLGNYIIVSDIIAIISSVGSDIVPVAALLGTILPQVSDDRFVIGQDNYRISGGWTGIDRHQPAEAVLAAALRYRGAPYLWGGRTCFGIDCSGLVQQAFHHAGILLPRDAWMQAGMGEHIGLTEVSRPADVAFFTDEDGKVTHTGILTGDGSILHASGCVRTDRFDHTGIYSVDRGTYTHKLSLIRRYL